MQSRSDAVALIVFLGHQLLFKRNAQIQHLRFNNIPFINSESRCNVGQFETQKITIILSVTVEYHSVAYIIIVNNGNNVFAFEKIIIDVISDRKFVEFLILYVIKMLLIF